MYSEYFGLEEMPFSIAPDPRYLYMSEQHREALAHLIYGVNNEGGFVLLTGEVGTGKTTVCRCLLEQIPEKSEIAFILNPKLTVEELLATICDELGIQYPKDNTSIKVFVDIINTYLLDARTQGRKTVLIIDEAQNLSADVLEQLRLLTNLETTRHKLLQIVLLGQPELKDKLSRPDLQQLAQRITARYHLGPLSRKDVAAYVTHRLTVAGVQNQLFSASIIDRLYRLSRGVPRLINILCDRALLGAFVQGQSRVNKSTLNNAAREVFGEVNKQKQQGKTPGWALALLVLTVLGAVLAAIYYNNFHSPELKPVPLSIPELDALQHQADHPGLDSLQWPAELPVSDSEEMAYRALFGQWDIPYQARDSLSACQQIQTKDLRCLSSRGSLSILRHLNRPAVLKLFDHQGMEFYAALTAVTEDTAVFVVGTETKNVPISDIALRWFGDYTLLWQIPPDYKRDIQPGFQGPLVQWLDKQLALIQGRESQLDKKTIYDDTLVQQIKKFQLAEGLVPDGIVGPHTLIHLNTALDSAAPLLVNKQDG